MSSSFANALTNKFMGFYESDWLNENNLKIWTFFLGIVDDISAAFDNEQDSINFLNCLNRKYLNFKFTIEKQVNPSIAFLDIFISGIVN